MNETKIFAPCYVCGDASKYRSPCDICEKVVCTDDAHFMTISQHHINSSGTKTLRVCENCLPVQYADEMNHDTYVKI